MSNLSHNTVKENVMMRMLSGNSCSQKEKRPEWMK